MPFARSRARDRAWDPAPGPADANHARGYTLERLPVLIGKHHFRAATYIPSTWRRVVS